MPTCTRCGTDDPGVYLGLSKLECVNSSCGAYVAPGKPGGLPAGRVDSLTYWKPGDGDARFEPLLKVNDDGSTRSSGLTR